MQEQRIDLVLYYRAKRDSVERLAAYAIVTFVLMAAMSRSVVTKSGYGTDDTHGETWDVFGGGIDNGFLVVFGPLVILVMAVAFDRAYSQCLDLRDSLISTVKAGMLGPSELSPVEDTIVSLPLQIRRRRLLGLVGPHLLSRAVYSIGLASVLVLLAEYATFRPADDADSSIVTLLMGKPWFSGFEPLWPRFPRKEMPWIYPPWYTITYSGIVSYLAIKTFRPHRLLS
ncbi:hypothetical protein KOR34_04770 [Posidoniimonas corsicana]|uniref:Uncharacterized protein n=1 Tax=Posidoniimonas corsicana TaxID=1938618 RepID=A0A5C5VAG2_9BACT|nr:hypothetical protein KOR34_04770 [Posidoniimonas corsicana]